MCSPDALHPCEGAPLVQKWSCPTKAQQIRALLRAVMHGLKKTKSKSKQSFESHAVDAWVLAASHSGAKEPTCTRLWYLVPARLHRRQLHRLEASKGGLRKPYGGTRSLGLKRGTLVRHSKYGLCTVGGFDRKKQTISLHGYRINKRLTQAAKVKDSHLHLDGLPFLVGLSQLEESRGGISSRTVNAGGSPCRFFMKGKAMSSMTLLGTGTCQIEMERRASSVLVELEGLRVLFECGHGIVQRLLEAGVQHNEVEHIVLSHFHTDHVSDIVQFLQAGAWSKRNPRTTNVHIYGPEGVREVINGLLHVFGEKGLKDRKSVV